MSSPYLKSIVDDMVWSYSRVNSFRDCPYQWFLKYVRQLPRGSAKFFSSYGSFMHELLQQYHADTLPRHKLALRYLTGFQSAVQGPPPSEKVFVNYFSDGLGYLKTAAPVVDKTIATEKKYRFKLGGRSFVGVVDLIGITDGKLEIVDHKSKALKPYSGREKPTSTDRELDEYYRQLYLYSIPVAAEFGKYPDKLCFNCFRTGAIIKSDFDSQKLEQAKTWALQEIDRISAADSFPPSVDYFKCHYLCDMCQHCEYYEMNFFDKPKGSGTA